jgi:hypothetical protein
MPLPDADDIILKILNLTEDYKASVLSKFYHGVVIPDLAGDVYTT